MNWQTSPLRAARAIGAPLLCAASLWSCASLPPATPARRLSLSATPATPNENLSPTPATPIDAVDGVGDRSPILSMG